MILPTVFVNRPQVDYEEETPQVIFQPIPTIDLAPANPAPVDYGQDVTKEGTPIPVEIMVSKPVPVDATLPTPSPILAPEDLGRVGTALPVKLVTVPSQTFQALPIVQAGLAPLSPPAPVAPAPLPAWAMWAGGLTLLYLITKGK